MQKILAFLEILTATLPTAVVQRSYAPEPLVILGGGRCTVNYISSRVAFGQLPDGLRLSPDGYLTGIPTRTGSFTFLVRAANECEYATRTLTVRVEGAPILVSTPDSLEFHYTVGGPLPEPQIVRVAANWKDLPYSIDVDTGPWLTLRPLRGRTPAPDSGLTADPVTVMVDPGKLPPGTYRATIRVTAWETTNEPVIPVVLIVEGDTAATGINISRD